MQVKQLKKSKAYKRMLLQKGHEQENWNWQIREKIHGPESEVESYNSPISEVESELESEEEVKQPKHYQRKKPRVSFIQTRSRSGTKKYSLREHSGEHS